MGVSGPQGAFTSSTRPAFTRTGRCNSTGRDMWRRKVGGQKNLWIRAPHQLGQNYGAPGQLRADRAELGLQEDRPLRPPCLSRWSSSTCESEGGAVLPDYNDFPVPRHTDDLTLPYVYSSLPPRPGPRRALLPGLRPGSSPSAASTSTSSWTIPRRWAAERSWADRLPARRRGYRPKGRRVWWELWDGNRWADLLPEDLTYGFTARDT